MIEVIIFDLANVIISVDHFLFCKRLAATCRHSARDIQQALFGGGLVRDYEQGYLSSREFYQECRYQLNLSITIDEFSMFWNEIFSENQAVSALIRALKKNYRLFLLSNTNELHFNFARREFPVLEEFSQHLLSYKLRLLKPSPHIFRKAIRLAKCSPRHILYIDDIPDYVAAARSLGINGIRFRSSEQLKTALAAHRVSWAKLN